MAESSVAAHSDVILPLRFEPDSLWSGNEESGSNDTDSHASFTERLGNTSWCSCTKGLPMLHDIECTYCRKLSEVVEHLEGSDGCVACLETFKAICLDKDVLYRDVPTMVSSG